MGSGSPYIVCLVKKHWHLERERNYSDLDLYFHSLILFFTVPMKALIDLGSVYPSKFNWWRVSEYDTLSILSSYYDNDSDYFVISANILQQKTNRKLSECFVDKLTHYITLIVCTFSDSFNYLLHASPFPSLLNCLTDKRICAHNLH